MPSSFVTFLDTSLSETVNPAFQRGLANPLRHLLRIERSMINVYANKYVYINMYMYTYIHIKDGFKNTSS